MKFILGDPGRLKAGEEWIKERVGLVVGDSAARTHCGLPQRGHKGRIGRLSGGAARGRARCWRHLQSSGGCWFPQWGRGSVDYGHSLFCGILARLAAHSTSIDVYTCMIYAWYLLLWNFTRLCIQNELASDYLHRSKIHSIKHAQPEACRACRPHKHVSPGHSLRRWVIFLGKGMGCQTAFPFCFVFQNTDVL